MNWFNRIPELLADYLQPWFVPRADYDEAQERKAKALQFEFSARTFADNVVRENNALMRENNALMEDVYKRDFKPFQIAAESAEVVQFSEPERIRWQGITLGWQVRINDTVFYSLRSPKDHLAFVREHAAEQLARSFKEHVRTKLLALPNA